MLELYKSKLAKIEAEIEAVEAADIEDEVKAKVAVYEDEVRKQALAAKEAKIARLQTINCGIEYLVEDEVQSEAEQRAAAEEQADAVTLEEG
jgi:hypothetical protein